MTTALNMDLERTPQLRLDAAIGFGGKVTSGLHIHPDGKHIVYALGSCIVEVIAEDGTSGVGVTTAGEPGCCIIP